MERKYLVLSQPRPQFPITKDFLSPRSTWTVYFEWYSLCFSPKLKHQDSSNLGF
jgi:hypothetical protein